jgi:putative peptide zinc metalloprotease protein
MATMEPTKLPEKYQAPIRARRDIEIERQILDGETVYIAKDPLSLAYFKMGEIEYFIFTLLDGSRDIASIRHAVGERYAGLELDPETVEEFIQRLRVFNFLESFGPQGDKILYARSRFKRRQRVKQTLLNFIFIKIPLCDPDAFLDRTYPYLRFIWSRGFMAFCVALGVVAFGLFLANLPELTFQIWGFLSPKNIILFWLTLLVVKALHELAHGYTCKHFGGEVHELGILLVVFTPWAYCNVSDSHKFPNSRHRFLVSMAGILTELFIASVATLIWWVTSPGVVNSIAYAIMIIASVNNVLFNGNPLLRYDGYFALSDFLEIPNLRLKAGAFIRERLRALFWRVAPEEDPALTAKRKTIYWTYGSLSFFYRILIVLLIAQFLGQRFFGLGILLAGMMMFSLFVLPFVKLASFLRKEGRQLEWRSEIAFPLCAGVLLLPVFLLIYSKELEVAAPMTVEASTRMFVRTEVDGELERLLVRGGEEVKRGQLIAVLKNRELRSFLSKLNIQHAINERQKNRALGQENYTERRQFEILGDRLKKEIRELEQKLAKLEIHAPADGTLLSRRLEEKVGKYFLEGDFIAEISALQKATARVVLRESDVPDVRVGQEVALKVYAVPARTYEGRVKEVGRIRIDALENPALSSRFGGDFPTRPNMDRGGEIPEIPLFHILIEIDNLDGMLLPGMTGIAKVYGEAHPLALIFWRDILRAIKPRLWF